MTDTASRAEFGGAAARRAWRDAAVDPTTLFAGLEDARTLVLAVSGGPDSMALMHLASRWAAGLADPPRLVVATVDHGLRADAAADCALVAEAAAALDLPCAVLVWRGPKPSTRIQERARAARYALLADHARAVGATHLLTAHHADDQAETVLMRLCRGSGVCGLAGIRRETALASGLTLVRPLLGLTKRDLVAICRDEGLRVAEDPSNSDPAYMRARLRAEAVTLGRLGLDRVTLARLATRMARADAALDAETDRLERMLAAVHEPGRYHVDLAGAREVEPEILLRLLRRAVGHVAGSERHIRLDRLEALVDAVRGAIRRGTSHRATLAGVRITLGPAAVLVVAPEPPRRRGRRRSPVAPPALRPN